jgi:integrase
VSHVSPSDPVRSHGKRPKRGHGEGSIRYREDRKTWSAQVSLAGQRLTKSFPTQEAARQWVRKMTGPSIAPLPGTHFRCTMDEYVRDWLDNRKSSLAPKTWDQYRDILERHVLPRIGRLKLLDLGCTHFSQLLGHMETNGIGSRTLSFTRAVLLKALGDAVGLGLLLQNPVAAVPKPRYEPPEMRPLSASEARRLLSAAKGCRLEALYHLAVTTGLRKGEILGLKWQDIDFERRRLTVQRQLQGIPGGGYSLVQPKTRHSSRSVDLGPETTALLLEHRQRQDLERRAAGDHWVENDLVFPSTRGTPMDQRNLSRKFKALLARAGLPDIRFHDLRHTCATLMLVGGTNPKIAAERLGHSDVSITLRTYSHAMPGLQQEAAEALDQLVGAIPVVLPMPDANSSSAVVRDGNEEACGAGNADASSRLEGLGRLQPDCSRKEGPSNG